MITTSFTRNLTQREIQILLLVAQGASARKIATDLQLAFRTVESHIHMMKIKTCSRNHAHLVAMALEEGLIQNNSQIGH